MPAKTKTFTSYLELELHAAVYVRNDSRGNARKEPLLLVHLLSCTLRVNAEWEYLRGVEKKNLILAGAQSLRISWYKKREFCATQKLTLFASIISEIDTF